MHIDVTYRGGLGDVIFQCFAGMEYERLQHLQDHPGSTGKVILSCSNPHAIELFNNLPAADKITVTQIPFTYDWPYPQFVLENRDRAWPLVFNANEEDLKILNEWKNKKYIVFCPNSGVNAKCFPPDIVKSITDVLEKYKDKVTLLMVGRNYEGHIDGRCEPHVEATPLNCVSLIDKLTVPGVIELVRGSIGVINAHTCTTMMCWFLQKPQFLLYPLSIKEQYIDPNVSENPEHYGLGWRYAAHMQFSEYSVQKLKAWVENVLGAEDHLYVEYLGGLGDIFFKCYTQDTYEALINLPPQKTADVVIYSNNPYSKELFDYVPTRSQLNIINLDKEQGFEREKYGLPSAPWPMVRNMYDPVKFYPHPRDQHYLEKLEGVRYLLISATSDKFHKNIPLDMMEEMLELIETQGKFKTVTIGKDYEGHDEYTNLIVDYPYINKVSVPGTVELVRGCVGAIVCHSAINMVCWMEQRPQFLMTCPDIDRIYMQPNLKKDPGHWGLGHPKTMYMMFEDYRPGKFKQWLNKL